MSDESSGVLGKPFEQEAVITIARPDGETVLEVPVGGYVVVYVGQPGTGNLPERLDEVPMPGGALTHPSQMMGGMVHARDSVEAINLGIYLLRTLHDVGLLGPALSHLLREQILVAENEGFDA